MAKRPDVPEAIAAASTAPAAAPEAPVVPPTSEPTTGALPIQDAPTAPVSATPPPLEGEHIPGTTNGAGGDPFIGPRPADAFDPGAKFHVADSTPYMRYFLAFVYEFQFYRAACQQAGWKGPLHRCTIYNNKEVGAKFNAMLKLGASKPWPDALQTFTGQRQIDASAINEYFAPLSVWLKTQNKDQQCGW